VTHITRQSQQVTPEARTVEFPLHLVPLIGPCTSPVSRPVSKHPRPRRSSIKSQWANGAPSAT